MDLLKRYWDYKMSKIEKYDSYKDSGVEWLGEIPSEWEVKRIKYITKFDSGFPFDSQKFDEDGSVIVVRIGDIKDTINLTESMKSIENKIHKNTIIHKYDTLIALSGATTGKSCFIKEDIEKAYINQRIAKFNYVNSFLYYCISNEKFKKDILLGAAGSAQENVSNSTIENMFIPFPNDTEQTKIASFLDTKTEQLDKAIKQKDKLINLLKERRQIIINNAVTKGLDKTVAMKDSGVEWIGEIPEHWEIEKVKYIFNLIIDPAPNNNNLELLSIYTDIGVKPRKDLADKGNKASTTDGYWKVKKGDFIVNKLLAWMGAIGLSEYKGVTSPAYDILRAKIDIVGIYYHELFRLKVFSEEMKKHSRGIMDMRLRLYFDKFGDIRVPYPEQEEQQLIVNYIEENNQKIDKAIDLQQKQITKLKEYKTTLIDSVVTGKVRV
jgi:type I restriction enzyme S subunit